MQYTSPIRAELLGGGEIEARILTLDEARTAARLWFVNSLRGSVPTALARRSGEECGA